MVTAFLFRWPLWYASLSWRPSSSHLSTKNIDVDIDLKNMCFMSFLQTERAGNRQRVVLSIGTSRAIFGVKSPGGFWLNSRQNGWLRYHHDMANLVISLFFSLFSLYLSSFILCIIRSFSISIFFFLSFSSLILGNFSFT